jgi:hypothetical protein
MRFKRRRIGWKERADSCSETVGRWMPLWRGGVVEDLRCFFKAIDFRHRFDGQRMHLLGILSQQHPSQDALQAAAAFLSSIAPAG